MSGTGQTPQLWVPRVILDRATGQPVPGVQVASNEPDVAPFAAYQRMLVKARLDEERRRRGPTGHFYDDIAHLTATTNSASATRKPSDSLSFSALRALGRGSVIDRLIINARKAQARRFARICRVPGKELGFRVVHRRYLDPEFDSDTPEIRARCAEMMALLERPTSPPHHSFQDWIENALEEELVLDRRCLVLMRGRRQQVTSYHLIDGATILPRLEALARWMVVNKEKHGDFDRAARQLQANIWQNPPLDQAGHPYDIDVINAAYVQMVDDRVVDAFTSDQMHVAIAHGTVEYNKWGYGRSNLEDSWSLSLLFMQALRFNKNLFDVRSPDQVLVVGGAMSVEGLEAFKRQINDYDPMEAGPKLPVIDGSDELNAQILRLRDTPRDMLMAELIQLLCNLKCAAYRMHPSTINVQPNGQGGAMISVDNSKGDEISQATEEGFHSLMTGQCDLLNEAIIWPIYDDLMVIVEGLDRENEQALIARMEFEAQYSTFNEMRAALNKKPLPKGLPIDIGDFVAGEAWFQAYQAIQGAQQQQQQASMGQYEQGDFGQPQQQPGQPWGPEAATGQQPGQPGQPGQPPQMGQQPGQPPQSGPPPGAPPVMKAQLSGWGNLAYQAGLLLLEGEG